MVVMPTTGGIAVMAASNIKALINRTGFLVAFEYHYIKEPKGIMFLDTPTPVLRALLLG